MFIICFTTNNSAAVSALARFGARCDELLPSILQLLQRSMTDGDDEVRDRATFYFHVLNSRMDNLNNNYILNGENLLSFV